MSEPTQNDRNREREAERERANAERERERAERERERAEREREKAQEEAIREAERIRERAERDYERAIQEAERARERADREREKAEQEAERARERAERAREKGGFPPGPPPPSHGFPPNSPPPPHFGHENVRSQARAHAQEMREHARTMKEQAREIRDQARQMADAQREIWRDFGEELRVEIQGGLPRRKPQQPSLSLEQIVKAAIDIADREGKDAISMRRIAAELQAGAMSLYWHVANKEELLQQMVDEIYAEMNLPAQPSDDWRADMRMVAIETRQIFLSHPWIATLGPFGGSQMGPGFLRHAEFSFAAVDRPSISKEMQRDIVHVVDDYTIGFATREILQQTTFGTDGESQDQWRSRTEAIFERIARTGIFPTLTKHFRSGASMPDRKELDRLFEFGLDSMLDGIAIRIQRTDPGSASRIGGRYV